MNIELNEKLREFLKDVRYIQMEYTNSKNTKAAYLIDINVNRYECIGKDKEILSELEFDDPLYEEARLALLQSLVNPKKREKNENDETYNISKELIVKNGKLQLKGYLESKDIITETTENDTRRPLTIAKDYIRDNYMHSTKFRTFYVSEERLLSGHKEGDILYI